MRKAVSPLVLENSTSERRTLSGPEGFMHGTQHAWAGACASRHHANCPSQKERWERDGWIGLWRWKWQQVFFTLEKPKQELLCSTFREPLFSVLLGGAWRKQKLIQVGLSLLAGWLAGWSCKSDRGILIGMDGSREKWKAERMPLGGFAYRFRFNAWFRYTLGMASGIAPGREAWRRAWVWKGGYMSWNGDLDGLGAFTWRIHNTAFPSLAD